eukprot:8524548-Pyramimonas_sp.AAC.1
MAVFFQFLGGPLLVLGNLLRQGCDRGAGARGWVQGCLRPRLHASLPAARSLPLRVGRALGLGFAAR